DGVTSAPAPLMPSAAAAGPRRHVLYIEDEPLNVVLMRELFESRPDWSLHIAVNGEQGLQMAHSLRPDMLLIDMNRRDMSGLQVLPRRRADPATAGLPCVALSADAMQEQIDAARTAGFDDYWTKPIDVARLVDMLGDVLEAHRAMRPMP